MRPVRSNVLAGLGCAALGTACRGTPASPPSSPLIPTTFFPTGVAPFASETKTVAVSPVGATKQNGHPGGSASGLTATVNADPNVVADGGTLAAIHSDTPFSKVLVSIVNSGAEIDGFWE